MEFNPEDLPTTIRQDEFRVQALQLALNIASHLRDPEDARSAVLIAAQQSGTLRRRFDSSVSQGHAGFCVLFAALDSCFPSQGWDITAKAHLEIGAKAKEIHAGMNAGLFSGLSGLAFAAWQLSRNGMRYRRLLASLDSLIVPQTAIAASHLRASRGSAFRDFDVISGLSGVGAYLLCRKDQPEAMAALGDIIDALSYSILFNPDLPNWYTPVEHLWDEDTRKTYPFGNFNCGLAHGLPGTLAFLSLAELGQLPLGDDAARNLRQAIGAAADWLLANRCDDAWGVNWPTAVHIVQNNEGELRAGNAKEAPAGPSRTAWCYGTPGIARSLWLAGRALDRVQYRAVAVEAMEAVFRKPLHKRSIDSAPFCHGVAGLLAVTLRFARETENDFFKEQTGVLMRQLLGLHEPDSLLGFRNVEKGGVRTDHPGLLDGASGVALVLLTAATGIEYTWDRLFLLS